jgi:hypothetical protein
MPSYVTIWPSIAKKRQPIHRKDWHAGFRGKGELIDRGKEGEQQSAEFQVKESHLTWKGGKPEMWKFKVTAASAETRNERSITAGWRTVSYMYGASTKLVDGQFF